MLPALSQAQVKLLRHPTYSNGKVAFSYLGDLWIANENGSGVQRLTDNKARDVFPRFSPDGNWIAFSSNREGNYDVYVVPATGGKPRQLTFHSADDNVVELDPGRQEDPLHLRARQRRLSQRRHALGNPRRRRHRAARPHRLGRLGQLLARRPEAGLHAPSRHVVAQALSRQLRGRPLGDGRRRQEASPSLGDDDYKGNCLWPMYARNGEIYYVANQTANEKDIKFGGPEVMKSVNNIWKISDKGGKETQVTHHSDGNLFFPSISADGKTIVYEDNFGLWKLDTASGKSTEIVIDIKTDPRRTRTSWSPSRDAQGFHLSPSNRRAAVVAHGEIFTIATDRGEPQRVSETPWKEQDPRWSPNGKWIAFVSDRTGREEVCLSDELGKNAKKISDADCDKSGIVWAPDSKIAAVERLRPQAAHGGCRKRQDRHRGAERRRQHRRRAVLARRQVDFLLQQDKLLRSARLGEGTGDRAGAHDRRRRFPAIERRASGRPMARSCC